MAKKSYRKSIHDISAEWDAICNARQSVIDGGQDISLIAVTVPCILRNISINHPRISLDVGCGSGYLTYKVAELSTKCVGIDISKNSIRLAESLYKKHNLSFKCCAIEDFVYNMTFDTCIANMVFMDDPNWLKSIQRIYDLLINNGRFYFTITHPCFWPRYWEYQDEPWFKYNQEIFVENEFTISLSKSIGMTTHIHRPLSQYVSGLITTGFVIEKIEEIYPVINIPKGYNYEYPRFLFFQAKKPVD